MINICSKLTKTKGRKQRRNRDRKPEEGGGGKKEMEGLEQGRGEE